MKKFFQKRATRVFVTALVLCLVSVGVTARQKKSTLPLKRANDAARHSQQAAQVFNQIMRVPDKAIPKELLEKAEAVAVFPNVLRAAFVIGGRKGQGVISRRTPAGWSAPAFFNLGGGSFGPQIGASSTDYVLLFMNDGALRGLLEDKFEIGGEAAIAAGPVGRAASASTNATLDAAILSYSRSKGAFVGVSLKGVVISPDNDLNEAFYGMKGGEMVMSNSISGSLIPTGVRPLTLALNRYSRRQQS